MEINYCGGWGYWKYCEQLIAATEKLAPQKYVFKCASDTGTTGRFEVTVYKTKEDLESGTNGTLLHSKATSKKFPW